MAYDFLYDKNRNLVLIEINYAFADWAIHNCPGYWDDKLNWHKGQKWPQTAQIEDFLEYINTNRICV